jgi:hypothetical protein
MEQLTQQLEILNNFIWEKPQVVVEILKKNGIEVSSKPTLPEITEKSVQAVSNDNKKFVEDITKAIQSDGENNFDPITLGVSALLSIGSAIFGSAQAKKQRDLQKDIALMNLSSDEKLAYANIQAMKEKSRVDILSNTILEYSKSLQTEATQRQKDTSLFIGMMAVGLAVIYSTIQVFKK